MKGLLICILTLALTGVVMGAEVRLEAGMTMVKADAGLRIIGVDLAYAMEAYYPGEVPPEPGVCWVVPDVNLVIWLYSENGVLVSIGYWTQTGFRRDMERSARGMVLNTGKGSALIDPTLLDGPVRVVY